MHLILVFPVTHYLRESDFLILFYFILFCFVFLGVNPQGQMGVNRKIWEPGKKINENN